MEKRRQDHLYVKDLRDSGFPVGLLMYAEAEHQLIEKRDPFWMIVEKDIYFLCSEFEKFEKG